MYSSWRDDEHPDQLDQKRAARPAVARADEDLIAQELRVVVAGEQDALGPPARQPDDQVRHLDPSERGIRGEGLFLHAQAERAQLTRDVRAGLPDLRRPGRPRADRDEALEMLPRAVRVEPLA